MYIKPRPIGTTPPLLEDRMPLWRAISGDDLKLTTRVRRADGSPARPDNSIVRFVLSETRFHFVPIWVALWGAGIEEAAPEDHPGFVNVQLPEDITNRLRRGVYSFSMTAAGLLGEETRTILVGNLLVEYEPTSPEHDIPYRAQDGSS